MNNMKKMMMVLAMVFTMIAGLFAYEPKKENAKVKRNGNVVYYEKTEPYNINGSKPDPKARGWDGSKTTIDYVKWVIRKGYTVEQFVDYKYERLDSLRDSYFYCMRKSMKPDVSNASIALTNCINIINGTNLTPEESESEGWLELAEYKKRTAIVSVPFVTEENWKTITREEMLDKIHAFIEEVKAGR